MMETLLQNLFQENVILVSVAITVISFILGFFISKYLDSQKLISSKKVAKQILEDARREAEVIKKEKVVEAYDEIQKERSRTEDLLQKKKREVAELEISLKRKEEDVLRDKDILLKRDKDMNIREEVLNTKERQVKEMSEKYIRELERVSGLSEFEARNILLKQVEEEAKKEAAQRIKRIEEEAKTVAKKKANEAVVLAIQRYASEHVAESSVSVVNLPAEEMKGRIIGREGRNIREFEKLTGVDLVVDDTPEAVIISAFDPIRREVAKRSLEKLIADGRIHPGRIEEVVEKSKTEIEEGMREEGEKAAYDLGIHNLAPELIKILGRLKYRTSYGQNILQHSLEVAYIGGMVASQVGADASIVRRACLLHDIGKAVDHQVQGPHALIGAQIAKKYNESPAVIHAISAHHYDEEPKTVEAILVSAADAISAARPGARRENLETYLKRLEEIEKIAQSFEGVEKAYAIQAGREVRVIVSNEQVDDEGAIELARNIAKKIEKDLEFPGEIKVTVIRETRVIEYAR
ncbi:MAG: ribonuclease Y [Candidatus Hydrogenedentota bacterium]